jgi:hypothetical protein
VLEETARVFKELGWPAMVTPFSQLVGTQAVLNVMQGERYRTVPDEVKKYALGYYGKLLAPVEPDVLDRIIGNGSAAIALEPQPLAPAVPSLSRKYPHLSDEERLLRHLYAGSQMDDLRAAGPIETNYYFDKPILRLLKELANGATWAALRSPRTSCGSNSILPDRNAPRRIGVGTESAAASPIRVCETGSQDIRGTFAAQVHI